MMALEHIQCEHHSELCCFNLQRNWERMLCWVCRWPCAKLEPLTR